MRNKTGPALAISSAIEGPVSRDIGTGLLGEGGVGGGGGVAFAAGGDDLAGEEPGNGGDQDGEQGEGEAEVVMDGFGDDVDDLGAVEDDQDGGDSEAEEASGEDGDEEGQGAHLEDSGGEDEELEGSGRGEHGGDEEGEELLTLEAGAEFFKAVAVDAFEEEEFASGTADEEGHEGAESGAEGGDQYI